MEEINGLGTKMNMETVATIFEVEESTVARYSYRYGGVRIGRRVLFFDKLVSEAVRETYALQKDKERKDSLGRISDDRWETEEQNIRLQKGCESLGSRDAQCGTSDRHTILAPVG